MREIQCRGIAAAPGIAVGEVTVYDPRRMSAAGGKGTGMPDVELAQASQALAAVEADISAIARGEKVRLSKEELAVYEAQAVMVADPELLLAIKDRILIAGMDAHSAIKESFEFQADLLASLDDVYLRERAEDLRGLARLVLAKLTGANGPQSLSGIILADSLAPADTMGGSFSAIRGLILAQGGVTSHTAILARSLGVPMVTGIGSCWADIREGQIVVVDGDNGMVIVEPSQKTLSHYSHIQQMSLREQAGRQALRRREAVTLDGRVVELWANIGSPDDVDNALNAGASGIGLFRTEFLYMHRDRLPNEKEQFIAYKRTLEAMEGKPVIIRTLDVGGDKPLPALPMPKEANPFLGVRGTRLCMQHPDVFRTQLRALFRASVYGQLWIMLPMIATVHELAVVKGFVETVRAELVGEGVTLSPSVKLGVMIEVPAAALCADQLAEEVDFFSIGSNDLIQYTMAADRQNENLRSFYQPDHLSIQRLIEQTVIAGRNSRIPVGLCGEMAGDPRHTAMLIGLGVDKLSMHPRAILPVKEKVIESNYAELSAIYQRA